jgi:hypothetical protein
LLFKLENFRSSLQVLFLLYLKLFLLKSLQFFFLLLRSIRAGCSTSRQNLRREFQNDRNFDHFTSLFDRSDLTVVWGKNIKVWPRGHHGSDVPAKFF